VEKDRSIKGESPEKISRGRGVRYTLRKEFEKDKRKRCVILRKILKREIKKTDGLKKYDPFLEMVKNLTKSLLRTVDKRLRSSRQSSRPKKVFVPTKVTFLERRRTTFVFRKKASNSRQRRALGGHNLKNGG